MWSDPDVKSHEAEVLQLLIDREAFTVKQLATRTGVDQSTVYRWLAGERTTPVAAIRAAFELTHCLELLILITGTVPVTILLGQHPEVLRNQVADAASSPHPSAPHPRLPPLDQCLRGVLAAIEQAAKSGQYMAQIARDGRFDPSDLAAANNFRADAMEAIAQLGQAVSAIEAYRDRLEAISKEAAR